MYKKILLLMIMVLAPVIFSGCSSNQESASQESGEQSDETKVLSQEATDAKAVVYFFWGDGCPHCAEEKPFLEEMEEKYPELEVKMFETWKNPDNAELFQEMAAAYGTQARGVPATFIGDSDPIVGFGSAETTGKQIENEIKTCLEQGCIDPGSKIE
ncbi:MAG: thioredoxin family protein [Candidatus Moranbacteria bacterium]|nr:thioredoxin family protein [Candidatus Moranbacteria bacterium]